MRFPTGAVFILMNKKTAEEKEFVKVGKAAKEKKADWLGEWLHKFSVEGDFWNKPKREKIKDNDFL